MPDATPESFEVAITGLSTDAEGIGRLPNGQVVFVDRTLPGDVAQVAITGRRKKVATAELVRLITPAPGRRPTRCDIWACGGCPLREAGPELAAQSKRDRLLHTMARLGGLDISGLEVPLHTFGDGWQYRHRVRLHAHWAPETSTRPAGWSLGYHERHSHALVPFSTCPVLWPELERLARAVSGAVGQLPKAAGVEQVMLVYSRKDGRGAARLVATGPMAALRESLHWLEGTELSGLHIEAADGQFRWGNLQLRYDHHHADAFDLKYEPGLFTQAHTVGNDALVAHVLSEVAPRPQQRVLELHAGIGNFSVPLARRGARVTAVERHKRSAAMLARNAEGAGVSVQVCAESDTWALPLLRERPDVLLMDPARSGALEVAHAVAALGPGGPNKVVYVSCDPATLARDAKVLTSGGLRLSRLVGLDTFPETPHVEAVATFVR